MWSLIQTSELWNRGLNFICSIHTSSWWRRYICNNLYISMQGLMVGRVEIVDPGWILIFLHSNIWKLGLIADPNSYFWRDSIFWKLWRLLCWTIFVESWYWLECLTLGTAGWNDSISVVSFDWIVNIFPSLDLGHCWSHSETMHAQFNLCICLRTWIWTIYACY